MIIAHTFWAMFAVLIALSLGLGLWAFPLAYVGFFASALLSVDREK